MKNLIKKIFNLFGLHLCRFNVINVPAYQTALALKAHNINVVFDVGANIGQFAQDLRMYGYTGKIISFEPLPQAYTALIKQAHRDGNWFVQPRCAVGAEEGEVEINVAANSASSSILPMLSKHENAAPESRYTHKECVELITLDSVLEKYTTSTDNILIKVDTQGYEWAVLDGAAQALKQSKGVLLELSLVPLYKDQKLWQELIERLSIAHYSLYAIQTGFTNLTTGQTLQIDGLFFRK
jgi:FkbM family methyltransferase